MVKESKSKDRKEEMYDSNPRITRLLNCFDNSTRKELLDFCRTISETQADVYFLMARKASCFFYCLEDLGLISLNGYVTSERVLDMDTEWLQDKDVIIIDDAIVSGTTINRTIEKLNEARVKSIKVYVLTVNKMWYQPDMLLDDKGKSYLYPNCNTATNEKCINLCYRVVKSILLQPRPYDIDFPLFNKFEVSRNDYDNLINLPFWNSYDVSTVEQQENNISSITFIPTLEAINDFELQENCKISDCALIKIRTYISYNENNKERYSISVLPMVVFDRVKIDDIERIFANIISDSNLDSCCFADVSSKLRLVQFYYSYKLALFWNNYLPESLCVDLNKLMLEKKNLRFIFPPEIDVKVRNLCACSRKKHLPEFHYCKHELSSFDFKSNIDEVDYISIDARLIEPFLALYHNKELDCRQLVIDKGRDAYNDEKYKELLQRLNSGISIGDLFSIIKNAEELYDCSTKISLFIDRSVDMGIIVPITQVKGDNIFRAFRHGEDVLFGEKEETMYTSFLYEFQEESKKDSVGSKSITHIAAEKLIVLFTKIGLEKKLLVPYLSNFKLNPKDNNDQIILRVKTYLKGPVTLAGNINQHVSTKNIPYITNEYKSMWLTSVFAKKGLIKEDSNGLYQVKKPDTSTLLIDDRTSVETLGILFGRVCNKNDDTGVTFSDDELTKISTCITREDCIRAIAAELDIFLRHFNPVWGADIIKDNQWPYEALNSALMKLKAHESGEAVNLIKSVDFKSRTDQNTWTNLLSFVFEDSIEETDESLKTDITSLYYRSKYVTLYLLCFFLLLAKANFLNEKKRTNNKMYADFFRWIEIEQECMKLCEDNNQNAKEFNEIALAYYRINRIINSCYSGKERSLSVNSYVSYEVFKDINIQIDCLTNKTREVLEITCCMLSKSGKISKLIRYNHAMFMSYKISDDEQNASILFNINKYISIVNNKFKEAHVIILQEQYTPDVLIEVNERSVWFVSIGNAGAEALAALSLSLSYALNEITSFKFAYFGDLDYSLSIKQGEDSNGFFMCNTFNNFISEIPSNVFISDSDKGQITMVMDKSQEKTNKFIQYIENVKIQKNYRFKYKKYDSNEPIINNTTMLISNYEARFIYIKDDDTTNTSDNLDKNRLTLDHNSNCNKTTNTKITSLDKKSPQKVIGIITVIPEETEAVKEILGLKPKKFEPGKRMEYEGIVGNYRVILTQCLEQGEQSSIPFHYLMKLYNAEMVCLVGIAGGIHDDISFTSVVLVQGVVYYDLCKDTPKGVKHRGRALPVSASNVAIYQSVYESIKANGIASAPNSIGDTIDVIIGDVASGSAVIANDKSEIRKWINDFNDKILACEMEAYGLCRGYYESEFLDERPKLGISIIRGISDMADINKSEEEVEKYRIPAAQNAAKVLLELIKVISNC